MPTIAIVNGHTFGAGVFLALAHDYRIQNPSRGYICLNEVDLGIVIPSSIATMLRHMMPSPQMYRTAVLEGKRFGGPESLKAGLVDALGGMDEALKMIAERNLIAKSQLGAVGGLKEDAHREVLTGFEKHKENVKWREDIESVKEKSAEKAANDIEKWERNSKL
jgi:enoyl-CoA hydratase/carnithine racemase